MSDYENLCDCAAYDSRDEQSEHYDSDHGSDCHPRSGEPSSYCGGCWGCLAIQAHSRSVTRSKP